MNAWSETNLPTPEDTAHAEATITRLQGLDREFTEAEWQEWWVAGSTRSWADYAATRASYEVKLWPAGRADAPPEVVSVEANSAEEAYRAAPEKHAAATGLRLVFEDGYPERKEYLHLEWHDSATRDDGRAR